MGAGRELGAACGCVAYCSPMRATPRLRHLAAPLVPTAVFGAMLLATAGAWPDPWVDTGLQLYAAQRIAAGDVLYRDLSWLFGPLSVYSDGALFALVGVSLTALFTLDIGLFALLCGLVYRLCAAAGGAFAASAATSLVIITSGFSSLSTYAGYQFVCPYSHELTHGVLLAVATLVAALRFREHAQQRELRRLTAVGVLIGLAALTKPEALLASIAAALPLVVDGLRQLPRERRARALVGLALSAAAPVVVALAALSTAMPLASAARALLDTHAQAFAPEFRSLPFYRRLAGLDAPGAHLAAMFGSLLAWLAAFAAIAWGALGLGAAEQRLTPLARAARSCAVALPALLLAALLAWPELLAALASAVGMARPPELLESARALPALALGVLVVALLRRRPFAQAAALLSLALLAKLGLHARIYNYGFALALPALALAVTLVLGALPQWVQARGGSAVVCRAAASSLVVLAAVTVLRLSLSMAATRSLPIETELGAFRADARGELLREALELVEREVPEHASLLVVPEGAMVNVLAQRRAGTRRVSLIPPVGLPSSSSLGEAAVLAELAAAPPDYLLLAPRDVSEWGFRRFGEDLAPRVGVWLRAAYLPLAGLGVGAPGELPKAVLARRRPGPPPLPARLPARDGGFEAWLRTR